MSRSLRAICFDSGDTIIDEATEIKNDGEETIRAELIPGADTVLRELKQRGYTLALVADGPVATFRNSLGQHGLYDLFDAYAISGEIGVDKPDARMFRHALAQLRIRPADYGRVVMVGNNLSRDIKGANQLGLISVWLNWSPRRSKTPADASERPQYTIATPIELLAVIASLEHTLAHYTASTVSDRNPR
jgi:FMN phosphatase YigB (HAD superfamily)